MTYHKVNAQNHKMFAINGNWLPQRVKTGWAYQKVQVAQVCNSKTFLTQLDLTHKNMAHACLTPLILKALREIHDHDIGKTHCM